jgi:hypothetical protein
VTRGQRDGSPRPYSRRSRPHPSTFGAKNKITNYGPAAKLRSSLSFPSILGLFRAPSMYYAWQGTAERPTSRVRASVSN